jgi:inorganic pyrophosphatase/exopolyphosphatase
MKIGIVGNEACDADSMVSAIVYAKLKNMEGSKNEYIPFFQCDDIISRLDFMGACKEAEFIPDGSIETITPENVKDISKWILVDHHYPTKVFLKVVPDAKDKVIEIIDHHSLVAGSNGNSLVKKLGDTVENKTIGSCTTLIANRMLRYLEKHNSTVYKSDEIQSLLKLLLCTIMIDTKNLTDASKTTEDDRHIVKELKQHTGISDGDADEIFKRLLDSKYNPDFWEVAPIDKILGYDYKDFKSKKGFTFGMSSILTNTRIYELDSINEYRKNLDVNAFCVNSSMLDGSKYLLMINFDKTVFEELVKVKEFSFEFQMYHKSKCEITKNSNTYKKHCKTRMYNSYNKEDDAYNGISENFEIKTRNGQEKGQKEDIEYSAVIFKIKSDFSRKKFTPILISILDTLKI